MPDRTSESDAVGLLEIVLGTVVILLSGYAVLTANLLLGAFTVALVLLGYVFVRWLVEFTRLFRRLVVAIERIAENS